MTRCPWPTRPASCQVLARSWCWSRPVAPLWPGDLCQRRASKRVNRCRGGNS